MKGLIVGGLFALCVLQYGTYVIAASKPDDERWAFPPNAFVRCHEHVFSDCQVGLVAYKIAG